MPQASGLRELTTTSYAILGLLGLRPWTTYELAQQMQRSLSGFWPRAESKIYEEPKKLVAAGLATSRKERTGKRPRTLYTITPAGRRALRAWLDRPGAPPALEFEGILKIFYGDQGTKEQLLRNLRAIAEQQQSDMQRVVPMLQEYLHGEGPFPERLHIIGLMVGFLHGMSEFVRDWARWAEKEVGSWPGVSATDGPRVASEQFRRAIKEAGQDVGGNGTDRDRSTARARVADRDGSTRTRTAGRKR